MFLRSISTNASSCLAIRRTLHSSTVWSAAEPKNVESSSPEKPQTQAQKTEQQQQKQQQPDLSAPKETTQEEKIEYIGNTRFPRPRIKPRKTITPGQAIGQSQPAEDIRRISIKEKAEQTWRNILSPEKNLENRAKIIGEIGESYFQNILDLRKNGAKLFTAPSHLIPANKAKFLPNIEGKTLSGKDVDVAALCRGKTTLLTIEFVKFAEKHTMSYINVFEKAFTEGNKAQVIQVNVEENYAKGLVLRLSLPYVRRGIPKHRHDGYVVHYGAVDSIKKMLGIANPLIGYAFLVDSKTRVRWYANGEAASEESETMVDLARQLLQKR
ncbi:Mitochondrial ATPase complex subunit atp10 [Coemansia sp. RSA 1200]|nr:Mitochondrial ATPase complex subunit atp10 [Coemansia sp. RSA 1200]